MLNFVVSVCLVVVVKVLISVVMLILDSGCGVG